MVKKSSKTKSPKKKNRQSVPGKSDADTHVLISKSALKSLQEGLARLELAFSEIANALRVLE